MLSMTKLLHDGKEAEMNGDRLMCIVIDGRGRSGMTKLIVEASQFETH